MFQVSMTNLDFAAEIDRNKKVHRLQKSQF